MQEVTEDALWTAKIWGVFWCYVRTSQAVFEAFQYMASDMLSIYFNIDSYIVNMPTSNLSPGSLGLQLLASLGMIPWGASRTSERNKWWQKTDAFGTLTARIFQYGMRISTKLGRFWVCIAFSVIHLASIFEKLADCLTTGTKGLDTINEGSIKSSLEVQKRQDRDQFLDWHCGCSM